MYVRLTRADGGHRVGDPADVWINLEAASAVFQSKGRTVILVNGGSIDVSESLATVVSYLPIAEGQEEDE